MSAPERGRIPDPVLDDRRWPDLVKDARALIPTYAPQWTDHNPSDIGMTLVELFAFLVEGLTYRLNRVPDKNYIAFLKLLGVTRDPMSPARAFLTFTAAPGAPVNVPKGAQAQTRASEAEPAVTFETDEPITVLPTNLKNALLIGKLIVNKYWNVSDRFTVPPAQGEVINVGAGQSVQLCLGFDQAVAQEIALRLHFHRPLQPDPVSGVPVATTTWTYSSAAAEPGSWSVIPGVVDETEALTQDGFVRFTVPGLWSAQAPPTWTTVGPNSIADQVATPLFWVGLRIANVSAAPIGVGISYILFNAASSHNALTIPASEALGASDGKPFQAFALRRGPLFKRPDTDTPYDHLQVTVAGAAWSQVDEIPFGPGNVYRIDPVTGEVRFGNYDGASTGHGSIPPAGAAIAAASYRYCEGGTSGNVGAGTIAQVRTPVPGIVAVNNLFSSYGGSDEEAIEDTKRRAPEVLRNRYRAVTAEDHEYLAREATTDVKIVRCLEPRLHGEDFKGNPVAWVAGDPWTFGALDRSPGNVNVIVVPDYGPNEPRPLPSDELVREVLRYLDKRRTVTARLIVTGPRYVPIKATVEVSIFQRAIDNGLVTSAAAEAASALAAVQRFLHPTRGGSAGKGWAVGEHVFIADLFKAVALDERKGFISNVEVEPLVPLYHAPPLGPGGVWNDATERPFTLALGTPRAAVRLADYELVCAADASAHAVTTVILS